MIAVYLKEKIKVNMLSLRKLSGLPEMLHAISNTTGCGIQTKIVFCASCCRILPTGDILWSCQCPVLLNITFFCWLYSQRGESELSVVPNHPMNGPAIFSLMLNHTFIIMVTIQLLED